MPTSQTSTKGQVDPSEAGDGPGRADARRNRSRILEAAESAFAEEGLGVPVDEIARRAGVGAGTLYRNFPTKEALFEAVIVRHMESLVEEARSLAASDQPVEALFAFLGRLAEEGSSKRNLVDALTSAGINVKESMSEHKQKVEQAVEVLLDRAQEAGEVRADVTYTELFGLVMGTCMVASHQTEASSQAKMVSIVCDGLRTR